GGGALGVTGTSTVTINASTFESNAVTVPSGVTTLGGGGAISVRDTASLTVSGGNFVSNSSERGSGGAIRVGASSGMSPNLTLQGATFTTNTANGSGGGAVAFGGTGSCSITLCAFDGNRALGSSGGAFATLSTASASNGGVQIDECTFRNNLAGVAGAVQIGSLVVITDSLFEANEATGATSGSFVLTGGAGAIRTNTAPSGTRVERSIFRNNVVRFAAGEGGGAIRASRGFLAINACTFDDNRVEVNPANNVTIHGGAVHLEGRSTSTLPVFSVTHSTFRRNTTRDAALGVGGKGGAIFTTLRQQLTITGNTFIDNTSQDGGHVLVETTFAGQVNFSDNSFTGGGAIPTAAPFANPGQGGDGGAASIVTGFTSTAPMIIDNTTVTNVAAKNTGGFSITSPTQPIVIEDSTFTNVQANAISSSNGGDNAALSINSVGTTIRRTTFTGLRSKLNGVRISGPVDATAVIEDVRFDDCDAIPFGSSFGDAGGLRVGVSSVTIERAEFIDCDARVGGGLYVEGSGPLVLRDATFRDCSAVGNNGGGARIARNGSVTIDRTKFVNNTAARGAGLWCDGAIATISNSLFAGNASTNNDGAVALDGNGSHRFINNTVANNTGNALYIATAQTDELINNVVWGNTGPAIIEINSGGGNAPQVPASYNVVQGGYAGATNLSFDPLFVDAANGDFTLASGSPAIDAGDNTPWGTALVLDVSGAPRFIDVASSPDTGVGPAPIVDMGAFERDEPTIICDDIDFNNNGVFPEDQDVLDFFVVLAGGAPATCDSLQGCNDIDFNNNQVFPEDQDVLDFFNVLAGGSCP
ncbi:MAG TPA: right-handed parallel beta-helix repeat-containing protein, partial [Phycisphaerales bacterium]|nr:right-handed parallel beta-helix repeat-containing protein [Phycisphaerales bacterium]